MSQILLAVDSGRTALRSSAALSACRPDAARMSPTAVRRRTGSTTSRGWRSSRCDANRPEICLRHGRKPTDEIARGRSSNRHTTPTRTGAVRMNLLDSTPFVRLLNGCSSPSGIVPGDEARGPGMQSVGLRQDTVRSRAMFREQRVSAARATRSPSHAFRA